jgi:hypothetical protein
MDESKGEPNKDKAEDKTKQVPPSVKGLKKTEDSGSGHHECQHKQGIPWPQRIEAACAVLLVFITGTYTVFAGRQWSVMDDTLKLERPWIGPTKRMVTFDEKSKHMERVQWYFQNGGRTVATKIRGGVELKIGPPVTEALDTSPSSEKCNKGEVPAGGNVAIPGIEYSVGAIASATSVIVAGMDSIYSNKVGLYLVGCVYYSDSSGKPQYRTDVSEVFIPNMQSFVVAPLGNEAY